MIRAKGKRNGREMTVEFSDGVFLFNGRKNPALEYDLRWEMDELHSFGGTWYPEKADDIRNILNCIANWFFDRPAEDVECTEEIEGLPSEVGVVY